MKKRIIVLLANGFEEIEAISVIDILRRAGVEVETVSLASKEVAAAHNIIVKADRLIDEVDAVKVDGIILPGGMPGSINLKEDKRVIELIQKLNEKNILIAAICAAPIVLAEAGIIKGRKITSYPGFEEELKLGVYLENSVVRDGNIITSRGPGTALDFALEIVDYICGSRKSEELEGEMLIKKTIKMIK